MKDNRYVIARHPLTGDPMWRFRRDAGGALALIGRFVEENFFPDYTLSIYDTLSEGSGAKISGVRPEDISRVVSIICGWEHVAEIPWIGLNSWTDSYVVAMPMSRGNIQGPHRYEGGKLVPVAAPEGGAR